MTETKKGEIVGPSDADNPAQSQSDKPHSSTKSAGISFKLTQRVLFEATVLDNHEPAETPPSPSQEEPEPTRRTRKLAETTLDAGRSHEQSRNEMNAAIRIFLQQRRQSGATIREIADEFGLEQGVVCWRLHDLRKAGLLFDSKKRRKFKGSTGFIRLAIEFADSS